MPKKHNIILKILLLFFMIFMCLYIANQSGYYESKIREEVVVTEDKIKEFETKIQNGEEVDVTSFLDNSRIDYSSDMSLLGDKITCRIEKFIVRSANIFTDIIKSLF